VNPEMENRPTAVLRSLSRFLASRERERTSHYSREQKGCRNCRETVKYSPLGSRLGRQKNAARPAPPQVESFANQQQSLPPNKLLLWAQPFRNLVADSLFPASARRKDDAAGERRLGCSCLPFAGRQSPDSFQQQARILGFVPVLGRNAWERSWCSSAPCLQEGMK